LEATIFEGIAITEEDVHKYRNATFRAVDFIHTFFYAPWDRKRLIKLTPSQVDIVDCVQFGFPLRYFSFGEIEEPPEGIVVMAPRQFGKSIAISSAAASLGLMNSMNFCGMIGAQEETSYKLMKKAKWFIDHSIFKDTIVKERMDYLELSNESFLQSHPCSEKSIRGSMYHYLLADEVRDMDENVLFSAALPTTRHGKRWIMITTPHGRKKKFMDYYYKGLETRPIICKKCSEKYSQRSFNVTNFPISGIPEGLFPCVECGGKEYKYGMGMFAVPYVDPWNTPLFTKAQIKSKLDLHDWSPWARQEYLGEIIDEASMVILDEWIKRASAIGAEMKLKNRIDPKKNIVYVLGIDWGRKHDASCFSITHKHRKANRVILDYIETIAGEFDEERSWEAIEDRFINIMKHFKPRLIVPDATGLGDPLLTPMERCIRKNKMKTRILNYPSKKTKGFIISRTTKPELIGELMSRMSAKPTQFAMPPLTEPGISDLATEMLRFECEVDKYTSYIKYGTQTYHDDMLIATALSVWGHKYRVPMKPQIKMFNYAKLVEL